MASGHPSNPAGPEDTTVGDWAAHVDEEEAGKVRPAADSTRKGEEAAPRADSCPASPPNPPAPPTGPPPSGGDSTAAAVGPVRDSSSTGDVAMTPAKPSRKARKGILTRPDSEENKGKVMRTLWPHPEIRKDFEKKAGAPVDAGRLLLNTRWRDKWVTFSRNPQPPVRERDALRKEAVAIIKKVSESKAAKPEKAATSELQSRDSKRKRDSSASSSGSGTTKPPPATKGRTDTTPSSFVIPKRPPPSTGATAEVMEQEEDGKEGTIARQLTVDDLKAGIEEVAAATTSYAGAAAAPKVTKPKKTEYEHMLFVTGGGEERTCISKETWKIFIEKYAAMVVDFELEDKPAPSSDWTGFKAGQGIIACIDAESKALARDIVATINVAEQEFRAWGKNEKGAYIPVTIPVPQELKAVPTGKIVALLHKVNHLPEGAFKFRSVRERDNRRYIHGVGHEAHLAGFLGDEAAEVDLKLAKVRLLVPKNG